MKDELKSCPFCGGKATWEFIDDHNHAVVCQECDCNGATKNYKDGHDSKEQAITAWNTRHVDLEGLLSVDELTEIIESVAKVYHIEHHRFPCPQEFASEIYRAQQKKMNSQPPSGSI